MVSSHNFGPAADGERFVFGSGRPGYRGQLVPEDEVEAWLDAMEERKIRRVVCLLDETQLTYYGSLVEGLIARYREFFGSERVLHVPVRDFALITPGGLIEVLAFLDAAVAADERVVVHCSGGSGRTGQVLAGWLVHSRGLGGAAALDAVAAVLGVERDPREVVYSGGATNEEIEGLIDRVSSGTNGAVGSALR